MDKKNLLLDGKIPHDNSNCKFTQGMQAGANVRPTEMHGQQIHEYQMGMQLRPNFQRWDTVDGLIVVRIEHSGVAYNLLFSTLPG
jgi:hypothetical protein